MTMTALQAWVIIGVPGLMLTAGLFLGRSQVRALLGYGVLVAMVLGFLFLAGDTASAAAIGLIAFLLVATGRGTATDRQVLEHHENRKRFTTADHNA